jgi:hypothetical protein
MIGLGLGLLVASITDFPLWWLVGAVLLIAGQLMIASSLIRPRSRTTE